MEQEEICRRLIELERRVAELEAKASRSKFTPPTLDEVLNEVESRARTIWSEATITTVSKKFYNFYESKDWYVGKNKMKKWKSALSNFMNDEHRKLKSDGTKQQVNPTEYVAQRLAGISNK